MATETTKLLPSIDNPRILTSYYTNTVSQTLKLKCWYRSSCTQSFNWYFSALTNENFSHSNLYTRHNTDQYFQVAVTHSSLVSLVWTDLFSEYVNFPNYDPNSSYIPLKASNQHPSSTEDLQASKKPVGKKIRHYLRFNLGTLRGFSEILLYEPTTESVGNLGSTPTTSLGTGVTPTTTPASAKLSRLSIANDTHNASHSMAGGQLLQRSLLATNSVRWRGWYERGWRRTQGR